MTEDDLRTILRRGDGRVELSPDVEGRIRVAMADELDRTLHPDASVISLRQARPPASVDRRWRSWVAAAVVLIVVAVATLVMTGDAETDRAAPDPNVLVSPPYLQSCLEFIRATSNDGRPWPEVLGGLDGDSAPPPDYLADLADALDALVMSNRTVGPASAPIRAAATEARRVDADVEVILRELGRAQDVLVSETSISCLVAGRR